MGFSYHTMLLMPDGTVKGVGNNAFGQLGIGDTVNQSAIQNISLIGVKNIVCGSYHTMFLMQDGTVKGVGRNQNSQLGIGNTTNQSTIQAVSLTGVKNIVCGAIHTMFLMEDGTVKGVGYNSSGQLGNGNTTSQSIAQTVPLTGVKQIACGGYHTMFLMQDGTVKGVGNNTYGQLGIGNTTNQSTIQTVSITGVKSIVCGGDYTMFLMEDGTVKGVGVNSYGQLGNGNKVNQSSIQTVPLTGVKQIACGGYHTIFLMQDGTVKAVGYNGSGQLGVGNTFDQSSIQAVPISGVKQIACGDIHTMFLMQNGSVNVMGSNQQGQLGIGNTIDQSSPQNIPLTGVKSLSEPLLEIIRKWLFKVGSSIKNLQAGVWTEVGTSPVTQALFASYGMDALSAITDAKLRELNNPELLVWSEEKGSVPKLKTTGVLKAQVIKGNVDIATFTLSSIRVVASSTGMVRILVSGDSGVSWKGKQVIDPSNLADVKAYGFTATELNALTQAQLAELAPNRKIRFAYYFEQASSTDIASVSAMYVNEKKYTATPNVSALQFTHDFATKQEPVIELKQNDGTWIEVKKDDITYAKAGQEWTALEVRAKLKNDQQLNAIAYSWT